MIKQNLGRILLASGLSLLILLFVWEAIADDGHVIEVRRNIPLADKDPIYRDFYLNIGTEAGLKQNQVVTAVRKISVKDASGTQSFGELMIPVGQLRIIYAQNRISVAREYKILSREENPMLEQTGIMSGDLIELKGSFVDNRKRSVKTEAQKETAPSEAQTAAASETPQASTPASPEAKPAEVPAAPAATETADAQKVVDSTAAAMDRVSTSTE